MIGSTLAVQSVIVVTATTLVVNAALLRCYQPVCLDPGIDQPGSINLGRSSPKQQQSIF